MANSLLITIFTILILCSAIEAAPRRFDIQQNNLSAIFDIDTPVRYDGDQVWNFDIPHILAKLIIAHLTENFDVIVSGTNGSETYIIVEESAIDEVCEFLVMNNIHYSIFIEDYQKQIDRYTNPPKKEIEAVQNQNGHRLTWIAYHRLEDIFSFLDYLVATYPDLCSLQIIGYSHERRPLKVLKISNGNAKNKAMWIDGGIHAREWISPASVTYIVNDLVENWDDQPEYIRNKNWYVLAVHNPDGYEYTQKTDRLWRKNRGPNSGGCKGVDLNRNYGHVWDSEGKVTEECNEVYQGTDAFSEPETAAVKHFFDETKEQFDVFLTFHSYGQIIMYPDSSESYASDSSDLDRVGRVAAVNMAVLDNQVYRVAPSTEIVGLVAGMSHDWAKSIGIKYSYTIELRDIFQYNFILPAHFIEPTAKEAREFVFTVSQAITNTNSEQY